MAQRLFSKTEFARYAAVSGPAISKALRGALRAALVGDRIDVDHPAAVAYLSVRGKKPPTDAAPTAAPKKTPRVTVAPTVVADSDEKTPRAPTARRPKRGNPAVPKLNPAVGLEQLAEFEDFADLTIRQLAERFGTFRGFSDLLDALKTIAETLRLEIANEEKRGSLISRDLVRQHLFGTVEATNKRLLGDAPRTISRRIYAMAKSSAPIEEAEKTVREIIGSQLRVVKATVVRVLREATPASN